MQFNVMGMGMEYFEMVAVARKELARVDMLAIALGKIIDSCQPSVIVQCPDDLREELRKYLLAVLDLRSENAYVRGHGLKIYLE